MNIPDFLSEKLTPPASVVDTRVSRIHLAEAQADMAISAKNRGLLDEEVARENQEPVSYPVSPVESTNTQQAMVVNSLTRARATQEALAGVAKAYANPTAPPPVQHTYNTVPPQPASPYVEYNWQQAETARAGVKEAFSAADTQTTSGALAYVNANPWTAAEINNTTPNPQSTPTIPYELGYEDITQNRLPGGQR